MSAAYLPFWWGAAAMAAVVLLHFLLTGKGLGISSAYQSVIDHRAEQNAYAAEQSAAANPDAFMAAMLAETRAQFGAAIVADEPPEATAPVPHRAPWTASALMLAMMPVGAALAFLARTHHLPALSDMGAGFNSLFGGPRAAFALLGGGLLVGMGTRMAGGCSSGHGLSGVSRFQPGSLLSTASFFGMAVLVSLALDKVVS